MCLFLSACVYYKWQQPQVSPLPSGLWGRGMSEVLARNPGLVYLTLKWLLSLVQSVHFHLTHVLGMVTLRWLWWCSPGFLQVVLWFAISGKG